MNKDLIKILCGAVFFVIGLCVSSPAVSLVSFFIAYIIVGLEVLINAVKNILHGEFFDENFLMGLATVGAFAIGEYPEGVAVMLFYQIGEFFQHLAVHRSKESIAELMDIRPDSANVKRNGKILICHPEDVRIGEIIVIKPGERVPLDCCVIEGDSTLDTSMLTGESVPRKVGVGSDLLSGYINNSGMLTAEVLCEFKSSTANRILELVENASENKSRSENFITKFAQYYTPTVVIVALLLAFILPLLQLGTFSEYIYRALVFLVVSCPCALVISIPLSFFGGIGGASKNGILIKGGNYLEALANTEIVAFDKTGTLTHGIFGVQEIKSFDFDKDEVLKLAAYAESVSTHPIAEAIRKAYGSEIVSDDVTEIKEFAGRGICAYAFGKRILVGNLKLLNEFDISVDEEKMFGSVVYIAVDDKFAGYIVIADGLKEDSVSAIKGLKELGVKRIAMLTGDSSEVAEKIGNELKIDNVYAELLPVDKVRETEKLLVEKSSKGNLVFVGDGINDAPVLARADVGVAMGGIGSDAAIEAADVVLMTDEPSKLVNAIRISRKTVKIAKENTVFAIGVKVGILILGAFGVANMWVAVFADVGVSLLAVLNALRALKSN